MGHSLMNKVFLRKIATILAIFLVQGISLALFYQNKNIFYNFKPSYLNKIYLPSYFERLKISFGKKNKTNNAYAKSIPILLYHGVVEKTPSPDISIDNFREQMFALKKEGYETVSLEDFSKFAKGEKNLPEKSFLLTFDDGRKDSYYPVDPILQGLNYNAVMFVITSRSLKKPLPPQRYHLMLDEIKKMEKSGRWEIESHTSDAHGLIKISSSGEMGHFFSNKMWLDKEGRLETEEEFRARVSSDLQTSFNDLKDKVGPKVYSIAYPFGDFGQQTINFDKATSIGAEITKSIFDITFSQEAENLPYSFNYPDKNKQRFRRLTVPPDINLNDFMNMIKNGEAKSLPYNDDFHKDNGWEKQWGLVEISPNNGLIVGSLQNSTVGGTILDGTSDWKNYLLKTSLILEKGSSLTIDVRYQDRNNHLSIAFMENWAELRETIDGKTKILDEAKINSKKFFSQQREIESQVDMNSIKITSNGKMLLESSKVNDKLISGGIGFETWDKTMGNSKVTVKSIEVEKIER